MGNIDLKNLNRKQLLELLLKQTKKVEEQQQIIMELKGQLELERKKVNNEVLIRELIKKLEQQCLQREAEAERKVEEANRKIEEAERRLEEMKSSGIIEETDQANDESVDDKSPSSVSTGDVLNDFFSSVIGK